MRVFFGSLSIRLGINNSEHVTSVKHDWSTPIDHLWLSVVSNKTHGDTGAARMAPLHSKIECQRYKNELDSNYGLRSIGRVGLTW